MAAHEHIKRCPKCGSFDLWAVQSGYMVVWFCRLCKVADFFHVKL